MCVCVDCTGWCTGLGIYLHICSGHSHRLCGPWCHGTYCPCLWGLRVVGLNVYTAHNSYTATQQPNCHTTATLPHDTATQLLHCHTTATLLHNNQTATQQLHCHTTLLHNNQTATQQLHCHTTASVYMCVYMCVCICVCMCASVLLLYVSPLCAPVECVCVCVCVCMCASALLL